MCSCTTVSTRTEFTHPSNTSQVLGIYAFLGVFLRYIMATHPQVSERRFFLSSIDLQFVPGTALHTTYILQSGVLVHGLVGSWVIGSECLQLSCEQCAHCLGLEGNLSIFQCVSASNCCFVFDVATLLCEDLTW